MAGLRSLTKLQWQCENLNLALQIIVLYSQWLHHIGSLCLNCKLIFSLPPNKDSKLQFNPGLESFCKGKRAILLRGLYITRCDLL